MNKDKIQFRIAEEKDVKVIFELIKELAVYEKMLDQVSTSEEILKDSLFVKKGAEVILAEYQGVPIGYAMYFYNFSSFTGKRGIYLEDIFIKPEFRGKGYGKALLVYVAGIAAQNDCSRMEWTCLNWNQPSIDFYESLGAVRLEEWRNYRLQEKDIEVLAGGEMKLQG